MTSVRTTISAAVGAAALAGAAIVTAARREDVSARAWVFTSAVRLFTRLRPSNIPALIAHDRRAGAAMPSKRFRHRFDVREERAHGMRVFRASPKGGPRSPLCLHYLHGGAWVIDLQAPHWWVIAGLIDRLGCEIVAPLYPLGPDAAWNETLDAITALHLELTAVHGAENVAIAGDSAGGNLALLLAQRLRDEGHAQPRAIAMFSPALDLSGSGEDQPMLERRDPMLTLAGLREAAALWIRDLAPTDPRVNPLFASHAELAPQIVFSGDRDILHSDALRLKVRDPSVCHRHYPGMMHAWVLLPMPEGRQALDEAAAFIRAPRRDTRR